MEQWEYFWLTGTRMVKKGAAQLETDLAAMGAQGWEVAGVLGEAHSTVTLILKRRLSDG